MLRAQPYGTIVAYAPARQDGIYALMLTDGERQVLTRDAGVTTAMAFSADACILALGGDDGRLRLLDMPTRQIQKTLSPPAGEHGQVVSLAALPAGGWVAGYASGRVIHWDPDGTRTGGVMESRHVSSLAVDQTSRRVAAACQDGHVIVHPAGLDAQVSDHALGGDRIVGVVFDPGGKALVAAAHDGTVRRTPV